jgi:death on curing protein
VTIWLSERLVLTMHSKALARHGGADGVRDPGLLQSALARPLNRAAYGDADSLELAALYAIAIARNHPFIDGNKRTAYLALEVFLALNGLTLTATDAESVVAMLAMAAGTMTDDEFILWVCEHTGTPD